MPNASLRIFAFLALALSLLFAPVLPAFATVAMSGAHVGEHAGHGAKHVAPADEQGSAHENCNDHCCLACTMHFVSVAVPSLGSDYSSSGPIPSVQHFNPYGIVSPPDRPPRSLS